MRPQEYVYVEAWGQLVGHFDATIKETQREACETDAPVNATFFSPTDGRWHTADDIIDPISREKINDLVAKIKETDNG